MPRLKGGVPAKGAPSFAFPDIQRKNAQAPLEDTFLTRQNGKAGKGTAMFCREKNGFEVRVYAPCVGQKKSVFAFGHPAPSPTSDLQQGARTWSLPDESLVN